MERILIKPIVLLADSHWLYTPYNGEFLLKKLLNNPSSDSLRAAYIGASNEDNPSYYDIFVYAMELNGIKNCSQISSAFEPIDKENLMDANLILLAGGDIKKGWDIISGQEMYAIIKQKYYQGTLIIGVSAGAIQLGLYGWDLTEQGNLNVFETMKLIPMVIHAHNEAENWTILKQVLKKIDHWTVGLGMPIRSGLLCHNDHTIEVVNQPVYEFTRQEDTILENLILPSQSVLREV
ncbi:MAG: hypothetical protein GF313_10140 [Caldithrix sp.]|nr:hypothetical protein [Caldithrix sp.]